MADRYVVLLRGINVGRAKRVAMADLRALVARLGYRDVSTLLNSGNVVLSLPGAAHDPAPRIERALAKTGLTCRITSLRAVQLAEVIRDNPLVEVASDPSRLMVTVLMDPRDRAKLASLARRDWDPEALAIGRRAVYQWCPHGTIDSPLTQAVAKLLGDAATTRNWSTILKLGSLTSGTT